MGIRWVPDGNVLVAIRTTKWDYEVRTYGGRAQACRWPVGTGGKAQNVQTFVGSNATEQAKACCERWEASD